MLPKGYYGLFHSSHIDIISSFFSFYSPNIDITVLSHLPHYKIGEGKVHSWLIFAFRLSHLLCNEWFSACPTTWTYWVLLKQREENGYNPEEEPGWELSDKTWLGMHQNKAGLQGNMQSGCQLTFSYASLLPPTFWSWQERYYLWLVFKKGPHKKHAMCAKSFAWNTE